MHVSVSRLAILYLRIGKLAANTLLAANTPEVIGLFAYAEFVRAGVLGLPRDSRIQGARDARLLAEPVQVQALRFGEKAYRILLSKLRDPAVVDDVTQGQVTRMVERGLAIAPGTSLRTAEAYFLKSLVNAGMDEVRRRQRERRRDQRDFDVMEIEQPRPRRRLENTVPKGRLPQVLQELRRIHERAPSYARLVIEDYTPSEIARVWGVTPSYVNKWAKRYGPDVHRVVRRHVEASRTAGTVRRSLGRGPT